MAGIDRGDNWKIEGCPVNGPAITADDQRVVVAWYTGVGDAARVRAAFSTDGGTTFRPAIEIAGSQGDISPLGRVGVVLDADGTAIVSWMSASKRGASTLVRRIGDHGARGPELRIGLTSPDRDAGFPRIARIGTDLVIGWTETSSPKRLHAVKLAIADVPAL